MKFLRLIKFTYLFILDECLTGNSLVLTNAGLIRIDSPSIVGQSVLSYNESNNTWEFKTVLNWFCKGRKPVYEIRTTNQVLRCTGNHPIRTSQGWVKAENLKVGMGIISPIALNGYKTMPHSACVDVEKREKFRVGKVEEKQPSITGNLSLTNQDINKANESILNGSLKLQRKVWPGGTWMTEAYTSENTSQNEKMFTITIPSSIFTQKATPWQKIKSYQSGWNHWGTQQKSKKQGNIITCDLPAIQPGSGWSLYANIQSHQWLTNLERIQSIELVEQELVYDIEVEDNHNFVANGLLVHNCHQLSSQAQNALLKCLEEPPHHVVFILCTTEQHKVLPTINSRCQTFLFRSLPILSIVQQLTTIAQKESIAITEAAKIAIARAANGGMRDALQLLDQLSLLGEEITSSYVLEMSGRIRSPI